MLVRVRARAPLARLSVATLIAISALSLSVQSDGRTASAAPVLFSESFAGRSTSGWIAGGNATACLTAGYQSGGIPACPAGAPGGVSGALPDPDGIGALRLTRNTFGQAGYVIYNLPIPTANGLDITFDYYAYRGTGGDGTAFMLIDGAANPISSGGRGGSLGYAPLVEPVVNVNQPGIAGGYLGIGLDDYGNYVNSLEGRDVGCPASPFAGSFLPDAVTIRGSAGVGGAISATPSFQGYCFLATTGTLTQSLDVVSSVRAPNVLRRVRIVLDVNRRLSVSIDFGAGYQPVIPTLDLAAQPGQPPLPSTVKLAFAAGTGARDNIHEVRNLVVRADRIGVRLAKEHLGDFVNGQVGTYRLTVNNNGTLPTTTGAPVLITDTLPAGLTYAAGSCTGAGWVCGGSGNLVTASYDPGPSGTITPGLALPPLTFGANINATQREVTNTASATMYFPSGSDADVTTDLTVIRAPDLAASIAVAPAPQAGRLVTFTAQVNNLGTYTATDVALVQVLSGPLTAQSATAAGGAATWTCETAPSIRCTAPALGLNASAQMTVVALVSPTAADGTPVGSQVAASTSALEIGAGANVASVVASVRARVFRYAPIVARQ